MRILSFILALLLASPAVAGMGGDMSFQMMDADKDGAVSLKEWETVFKGWDANADGKLDAQEWAKSHGPMGKGPADGMGGHGMGGKAAFPPFKDMDANADNAIDKAEYDAKVKGGGFEIIDTDKGGRIEAKEWESFLKAHMGPMGK